MSLWRQRRTSERGHLGQLKLNLTQQQHSTSGYMEVEWEQNGSILLVKLAHHGVENITHYEGSISADGLRTKADLQETYGELEQGLFSFDLDLLELSGSGFKIKLRQDEARSPVKRQEQEAQREVLMPFFSVSGDGGSAQSEQEELMNLRAEVAGLYYLVQALSVPRIEVLDQKELSQYGWEVHNATQWVPEGPSEVVVPEDDILYRGSFTGDVKFIQWQGKISLEGQVTGIGDGLKIHSQRTIPGTAWNETCVPVFRLPESFRPKTVQTFSRRWLGSTDQSNLYKPNFISLNPFVEPKRSGSFQLVRLDVLPDGFVVIVVGYKSPVQPGRFGPKSLTDFLKRKQRWFVNLKGIEWWMEQEETAKVRSKKQDQSKAAA